VLFKKHFIQTFLRPPCAFFHVPAKKRLPIVISLKLCRNSLIKFFTVLVIISSFFTPPAFSQESEDSQIFISGFNAYQQKNYTTTISKMNEVLQKHPDTPLRDMVLFWLSRAYFKNGNQQDAAKYMSQFSREYPDNPLKGTVDEELLALTARYDKGEQLPKGSPVAVDEVRQQVAQKSADDTARIAGEKAEKERLAKEQAERQRVAAAKAEEQRLAAEAEKSRLAAAKIAEDRAASEAAEQLRLANIKKDAERKAAEQLKAEREKAELERLALLKNEQERVAVAKVEEARLAQEKAAAARQAIESAEQQKLAARKAQDESKAAEQLRAEQERLEQLEHETLVKQQEEMLQRAMDRTEKKRLAYEKAEQEQNSAEETARVVKAEKKRLAALKAEEERVEEERLAAIRMEEERKVAEKAEQLRVERERVEKERAAAIAAESARLAAAQKELELKAAEKAQAERAAQEQAVIAKRAAAEAEQQKLAQVKKEQERLSAERAEKERLAATAAEVSQKQAAVKQEPVQPEKVVVAPVAAAEKDRVSKAALREKAIDQYKSIIVAYPKSNAAVSAAAKLKELGVAVALPAAAPVVEQPAAENAQVLRFEVAQFGGLEFNLLPQPLPTNVAQRVSIPFEIINQGNGSDSFYLESGFPTEFSTGFSSSTAPAQAINQTSVLAPGESFKGLVNLTIPASSIDGLRISHPIKASSRTVAEASQSREVRLVAAAPLLRATVKVDRNNPLPGEKLVYRVAVLNVGSTGAQDVSFRLNFPPQLEPVDFAAAGFRQEMKAALVIDGLQLKSGESREFSLAFQLKDGSLAGQEILTRAELNNNLLKTSSAFVSTAAYVQPQHGLAVTAGSDRLVVIPGQTVSIPFTVTNTGNVREKFTLIPNAQGSQTATIFHDLNRDGVRQANEPIITEVGPLAAKEEASVVMEITTPRSAVDGTEDSAQLLFRSSGDATRSFAGMTKLIYSRPVLQMAMTGKDGRLKPGDVASFDLAITNRGSNLARIVELKSAWPEQLELVAADPASSSVSNGTIIWKFKELGAGEKRVIRVSLRVKPGTGVGTNIQVKNILTYEDQIGNRY
jgi:uncharacterized repeat protein (TIGR01451 family)